jgi:hypothetical protein
VLRDVENHRLDQRNGVILISCSDGDQFCDIFKYQENAQVDCRSHPRIHVFTCHGGALAYAPYSPVNRQSRAHRVHLSQIPDARNMKNINAIALYAHAPCAAVALCNLPMEKAVALQFKAKQTIKNLNEGIDVACFFHVDHENDRKRTYFLCREAWESWAEENSVDIAI